MRDFEKLLKLSDVIELTGVTSSTIYRWIENEQFPKPIAVGPNTRRWRASDLIDWQSRLTASSTDSSVEVQHV